MAKVQISTINIVIGDKELSLSIDEARELHKILSLTLKPIDVQSPERIIERLVERHHDYYHYWQQPTIKWTSTPTVTSTGPSGTVANGLTMYLSANNIKS